MIALEINCDTETERVGSRDAYVSDNSIPVALFMNPPGVYIFQFEPPQGGGISGRGNFFKNMIN